MGPREVQTDGPFLLIENYIHSLVLFTVAKAGAANFCVASCCHQTRAKRGQGGIEPPTSRTRSENHTTRPLAHVLEKIQKVATSAGFEPARAEPIGFQVQRLNHSAMMPYNIS